METGRSIAETIRSHERILKRLELLNTAFAGVGDEIVYYPTYAREWIRPSVVPGIQLPINESEALILGVLGGEFIKPEIISTGSNYGPEVPLIKIRKLDDIQMTPQDRAENIKKALKETAVAFEVDYVKLPSGKGSPYGMALYLDSQSKRHSWVVLGIDQVSSSVIPILFRGSLVQAQESGNIGNIY